MKCLLFLFSLILSVSAVCLTKPAAAVSLYIIFDVSDPAGQVIETRHLWAEGFEKFATYLTDNGQTMTASYSRTTAYYWSVCWTEDLRKSPMSLVASAIRRTTGYPMDEPLPHLAWNMAAPWLHQGYWRQSNSLRRILFLLTGQKPWHPNNQFIKFPAETLSEPRKMCPISHMVSEKQATWSLRKTRGSLVVAVYPAYDEASDLWLAWRDFLQRNDITDAHIIPKVLPASRIPDVVELQLKSVSCETWTATTTKIPACWKADKVATCLEQVDAITDTKERKFQMFRDCILPSCFDWEIGSQCIQQFDPTMSCNWVEDLMDCIDP